MTKNRWFVLISGSDALSEQVGDVKEPLPEAHDPNSAMAAASNFMSNYTPETLRHWMESKLGITINRNEQLTYQVVCSGE